MDIYGHLCLTDMAFKTALIQSGPRPFTLHCSMPWGDMPSDGDTGSCANVVSDILVDTCVRATAGRWTPCSWLVPGYSRPGLRNATRRLVHEAICSFGHHDPDFCLDPLFANRRFQPYAELAELGTMVVSGMTTESIQVLIPDCTVSPVGSDVIVDLQHVVEFSMGAELPTPNLPAALLPKFGGSNSGPGTAGLLG